MIHKYPYANIRAHARTHTYIHTRTHTYIYIYIYIYIFHIIQTSESYKVVGTRMFYENERGKSSIKIHGPIRESVVIVVSFKL